MKLATKIKKGRELLSSWAGCNVVPNDDFDTFCDCDYDYIEILMLFEKEFGVNLLDGPELRHDFLKVDDFIQWVISKPSSEEFSSGFRFFETEIICLPKFLDYEEACA